MSSLLAEWRHDVSVEYVDGKNLIALLQAAHDYAAANEHRADYWTAMAAYLASEGLTYRYEPPRDPIDWGMVQRAHIACCWCGGHHEEGD